MSGITPLWDYLAVFDNSENAINYNIMIMKDKIRINRRNSRFNPGFLWNSCASSVAHQLQAIKRFVIMARERITGCGAVVLLGGVLLFLGCEGVADGASRSMTAVHSGAASNSGPVELGEGDIVKFFFPGATEYSNSQKIRTDGKVTLPLLGEIQAAGKTVSRLQSELTSRYKAQLQNSEVVVSLELSGKPVIISGGVASPGKFVFDRPTTLLEAIMGAGGFTDFAKTRKVRLIRIANSQYHTVIYDLSNGLKGGAVPLVYIKGGDLIHVPISNW